MWLWRSLPSGGAEGESVMDVNLSGKRTELIMKLSGRAYFVRHVSVYIQSRIPFDNEVRLFVLLLSKKGKWKC